jgi:hypothetical protein
VQKLKPTFFTIQTTPIMTRHLPILLLSLFCGLLLWSGCKKDDDNTCWDESNPECPNYDPCWDKRTPVSADFEVGAYFHVSDGSFPKEARYIAGGDTFINYGALRFTALDLDAETYEWRVGSDDRIWTDSLFFLSFPCNVVSNSSITVQLITTRLRDTICVSAEVLRDTLQQQIHFVFMEDMPFMGTYEGVFSHYDMPPYQLTVKARCRTVSHDCSSCLYLSNIGLGIVNALNDDCEKGGTSLRTSTWEFYINDLYTSETFDYWLEPELAVCDLTYFGEDYRSNIIKNIHGKVYGEKKDSIEIRFDTIIFTDEVGNPTIHREDFYFRGKRVQ